MKVTESAEKFKRDWLRAIGPQSAFSQGLTPEGRAIRRLLEDAPPDAVKALLEGLSIDSGSAAPLSPAPPAARPRRKAGALVRSFAAGAIGAAVLYAIGAALAPRLGTPAACMAIAVAGGIAWAAAVRRGSAAPAALPAPAPAISVSADALDKAVALFAEAIRDTVAHAKEREDDAALGFDVTASKSFGEWVQKFADEAHGRPSDVAFLMLKEELVSKLRAMGITVHDRIRHAKDGSAVLPPRDCYRDGRPSGKDDFTEVVHAPVASRRGVLAVGELR